MEVADGRRLTVHKSVFVRFPLKGRDKEYLLVWTTTPWTLTSNVAAAVNPELKYVKLRAKRDGALYYFAEDNLEFARLQTEFKQGFGRPEWEWPKNVGKLKTIAQIFKEQGGYELEGSVLGKDLVASSTPARLIICQPSNKSVVIRVASCAVRLRPSQRSSAIE